MRGWVGRRIVKGGGVVLDLIPPCCPFVMSFLAAPLRCLSSYLVLLLRPVPHWGCKSPGETPKASSGRLGVLLLALFSLFPQPASTPVQETRKMSALRRTAENQMAPFDLFIPSPINPWLLSEFSLLPLQMLWDAASFEGSREINTHTCSPLSSEFSSHSVLTLLCSQQRWVIGKSQVHRPSSHTPALSSPTLYAIFLHPKGFVTCCSLAVECP